MSETGLHCTYCGKPLAFREDVVVKATGYIAGPYEGDGWVYVSDAPFVETLCQECGAKLHIQEVQE